MMCNLLEKSKVLIRSDLHPEIVQLLLQTMKEVHGGADLFHRSGEYPNAFDSEYAVAPTAIDFYKNGPSFMQRHLPLWLSIHVQRAIAVGSRIAPSRLSIAGPRVVPSATPRSRTNLSA